MRLTGPGGLLGYISDFSLSSYFSNFLVFRHPRSLNQSKSLKSRLFPLLRGLKKWKIDDFFCIFGVRSRVGTVLCGQGNLEMCGFCSQCFLVCWSRLFLGASSLYFFSFSTRQPSFLPLSLLEARPELDNTHEAQLS